MDGQVADATKRAESDKWDMPPLRVCGLSYEQQCEYIRARLRGAGFWDALQAAEGATISLAAE